MDREGAGRHSPTDSTYWLSKMSPLYFAADIQIQALRYLFLKEGHWANGQSQAALWAEPVCTGSRWTQQQRPTSSRRSRPAAAAADGAAEKAGGRPPLFCPTSSLRHDFDLQRSPKEKAFLVSPTAHVVQNDVVYVMHCCGLRDPLTEHICPPLLSSHGTCLTVAANQTACSNHFNTWEKHWLAIKEVKELLFFQLFGVLLGPPVLLSQPLKVWARF